MVVFVKNGITRSFLQRGTGQIPMKRVSLLRKTESLTKHLIMMKRILLTTFAAAITAVTLSAQTTVADRIPTDTRNTHYPSAPAPLAPQSFIKLPTGTIQPGGWLRTTLELQQDGLCGHLGEISAWLQKDDNAWLKQGGEWGWEEVPYWLRGYSDMAFILGDKAMITESLTWIEAILSSQRGDGNFGPVVNRAKGQDLWPNMIALWILQNYYEWTCTPGYATYLKAVKSKQKATPDQRVLDFMARYFAYQLTVPDEQFLEDYWENSRAGDNIWSVAWLYSRTGDESLLALADKLHSNAADWTRPQRLPNWHNVNIAQSFREPALYSLFSHDEQLTRASYNVQRHIRKAFGQVPGGMFGGDENSRMGYFDPRQGTETCAFAEQMASDELMLLLTGDPYWAANCEDVTFNSLPAAFMDDYRALRYITAPNMVVSDSENHAPGIDNAGPFLSMNPFSSRCCQHNHGFAWPYYNDFLLLATPDDGIAAVLYNSCTANVLVGSDGQEVTLTEQTDYPFSDRITFTLDIAKGKKARAKASATATFPLWLRIPEWCSQPEVTINGTPVETAPIPGKYLCINRTWTGGDVVELTLPMHVSMRHWQVNNHSVSVDYGPLTLSLEIPEEYRQVSSITSSISDSKWQKGADASRWPTTEIYPLAPWNYALCTSAPIELIETRPVEPGVNPFRWDRAPLVFKAQGRKVPSWTVDEYGLCAPLPFEDEPLAPVAETIRLIPMGTARLRISAFPDADLHCER